MKHRFKAWLLTSGEQRTYEREHIPACPGLFDELNHKTCTALPVYVLTTRERMEAHTVCARHLPRVLAFLIRAGGPLGHVTVSPYKWEGISE